MGERHGGEDTYLKMYELIAYLKMCEMITYLKICELCLTGLVKIPHIVLLYKVCKKIILESKVYII